MTVKLKLYQFVDGLVTVGAPLVAEAAKVEEPLARSTMLKVAREFCELHAYSTVYIPSARNLANVERDAQIWRGFQTDSVSPSGARKFTPERARELAREHRLTPQRIYEIIKTARQGEAGALSGQPL